MRIPRRLPALLLAAFLLGLAAWIGSAKSMDDPLRKDFAFLGKVVDAREVDFVAPDVWRIDSVGEDRFATIVRAVPQKGFQGGFRPFVLSSAFVLRTPDGRTPPLTPGREMHRLVGDPGPDGIRPVVVYDPTAAALWLVRAADFVSKK